jgi:SIR2-like protein
VDEDAWETLLDRIQRRRCTPFLGAGATYPTLPLARDIATAWSRTSGLPPGEEATDLARVAQFLSVKHDPMQPKHRMCDEIAAAPPPDFANEGEPHRALADLALPLYMTTNYDGFMLGALRHVGKEAHREICRWNSHPAVRAQRPVLAGRFEPSPEKPVVFHMHGHIDVPESLVLTEDDYLDFLVEVGRNPKLMPPIVQGALAGTVLFVGYSLRDWDFRVLMRSLHAGIPGSLRSLSVAVQVAPDDPDRDYLTFVSEYFDRMDVRVFWGTASEFAAELAGRRRERDGST